MTTPKITTFFYITKKANLLVCHRPSSYLYVLGSGIIVAYRVGGISILKALLIFPFHCFLSLAVAIFTLTKVLSLL